MKKQIAILGSTGSIGKTLIKIISKDKKNFEIKLLTGYKNYKDLIKQAKLFKKARNRCRVSNSFHSFRNHRSN